MPGIPIFQGLDRMALETDSSTLTSHTHGVKRVVLDDSGHCLADVLRSLDETNDTSRIPDTCIPSVSKCIFTENPSMDYSKIITGLVVNCVKFNRRLARPALDIEEKRLRDFERDVLERIAVNRQQINMTLPERRASQIDYQILETRLRRSAENAISNLNVKELAEREFQEIKSEPTELTGEFRVESDYENVVKRIEIEQAKSAQTQQRQLWKETYYWPMIQQRAKMSIALPIPSGPKSEVNPQEKVAAKRLVHGLGNGTSRDNFLKWTSYWRLLSDLRIREATTLLLYRTSEFKTHFFRYPKKPDLLLSWNQVLDLPLQQLRMRVIAEEANDFSGKSDIQDKQIFERLRVTRTDAWRDDFSDWGEDKMEHESFLATHAVTAISSESNKHVLCQGIKGESDKNKAIFISMIPYEGESTKRVIGKKPASTKFLSVSSLVHSAPGDFLGIFSGKLRYLDSKPLKAIEGPLPGLWLGKLNHMRIAKPGESTNVCLAWEGVNELREETSCQYWRVLVIATRHIMPLDRLIRPP